MRGKKQVWRIAAVGALAGATLTTPAHAVGEELVGNTVASAVQRVAESLPPVELLPAPAPIAPAPPIPAPAAPAPAAPSPVPSAPAAPPPSATRDSSAAASGSVGAASAGGSESIRRATSGSPRRAASASARGADPRATRGKADSKANRLEAYAASSDDVVATAAQAGETADAVVTGAQPSVDSGGSLPFTGADLALLVALGLAAMGTGLALRRVAAA